MCVQNRHPCCAGQLVSQLSFHESVVRDVSWHPTEPLLVSVSWDGGVVSWAPSHALANGWSGRQLRGRGACP